VEELAPEIAAVLDEGLHSEEFDGGVLRFDDEVGAVD
jgi:hypothetical protein